MKEAKECCGVFGIFGDPNAVEITYRGLYAQQHRGEESAGIASVQKGRIVFHKAMGHVGEVFQPETLRGLRGDASIGHVRYSTTGVSSLNNTQPLVVESPLCMLAVAHNGNLVNSATLRREMESQRDFFPIFHTSTDTEIILYLASQSRDLTKSLKNALRTVKGSYSLLFLTPTSLIAARDPNGFRPLALGRVGNAWAVASETCAFEINGIKYERDIEPGEILVIDRNGTHSSRIAPKKQCNLSHCTFEHVYFARPDSRVFGDTVHLVRRRLGAAMAKEHPVPADVVTAVPDSGNSAALGYAAESGIPYESCFIRNHYVGRTFIQPTQAKRSTGVTIKLAVVRETVEGKRVIVIDDSIVRGTTSQSRMALLRRAGAKEVHLRISCPPIRHPCYYGIDFPTQGELIASNKKVEEIRQHLKVDSLGYLSLDGMLGAMSFPAERYCTSCWTGKYPVAPVDAMVKERLESSGAVLTIR